MGSVMTRQHTRCTKCRKLQNCFLVDSNPFDPIEWLCRDCVQPTLSKLNRHPNAQAPAVSSQRKRARRMS